MGFVISFLIIFPAFGDGYFTETFEKADGYNENDWIVSEINTGTWLLGKAPWLFESDEHGLMTSKNNSFFGISRSLPRHELFSKESPLIFQFQLTVPQIIECGGNFLKLFPVTLNPLLLSSTSESLLTFGPDFCGTESREVVFALTLVDSVGIKRSQRSSMNIRAELDRVAHTYTLALYDSQSYEIFIDYNLRYTGSLSEDFLLKDGDKLLLEQESVAYLGTELWQVRCGSIFDNIFIGHSIEEAKAFAESKWPQSSRNTELSLWLEYDEKQQRQHKKRQLEYEDFRLKQEKLQENGRVIF